MLAFPLFASRAVALQRMARTTVGIRCLEKDHKELVPGILHHQKQAQDPREKAVNLGGDYGPAKRCQWGLEWAGQDPL